MKRVAQEAAPTTEYVKLVQELHAEEAAPTTEYVKLVQELHAENEKLEEGQLDTVEYKKYMQKFIVAKTALTKDIDHKLHTL